MSDLEQLAAAARGTPTVPSYPAPMLPPQARPQLRRKRWHERPRVLMGIGAVVMLAALAAWGMWGGAVIPGADPGIAIWHDTAEGWAAWGVTNREDGPLTISRVRLNGEYDCPRAYTTNNLMASASGLPVTLSIGETRYFHQFYLGAKPMGYSKAVVYVDIDTNRGRFRYRVGQGWDRP